MPRARLISPEFWTSEAVVDRAPTTRLPLPPAPDHSKPLQSGPAGETQPPASDAAADAAWHDAVEGAVRRAWGADVSAGVAADFTRPFHLDRVDGTMAGTPMANHSNPAM